MKKYLSIIFIILPLTAEAANYYTAQELLQACKNSPMITDETYCMGYVSGAIDGVAIDSILNKRKAPTCIPNEVTKGEAVAVFVKWLENNPRSYHSPAVGAVISAMVEAYPCSR